MEFLADNRRKAPLLHDLDQDDQRHPLNIGIRDLEDRGFKDLTHPWQMMEVLKKQSITKLNSFQIATIKALRMHGDVLVRAKPGCGKTLAYLINITDSWYERERFVTSGARFIIFAATRELCEKVYGEVMFFLKSCRMRLPLRAQLITREMPSREMSDSWEYPVEIFISTPDHVLSAIKQGNLQPSDDVVLIFDEMDPLLSSGHGEALKSIISCVPKCYRCWVFSSQQSCDVKQVRNIILRNPFTVTLQEDSYVKSEIMPFDVQQTYILCKPYEKFLHICRLLLLYEGTALILTNSTDMRKKVKIFIEDEFMDVSICELFDSGSSDTSDQSLAVGGYGFDCFVGTHQQSISLTADIVINFDMPPTHAEYAGALRCATGMGYRTLCTLVCHEEMDVFKKIKSDVESEFGDSDFIFPESRCYIGLDYVAHLTEMAQELMNCDMSADVEPAKN